MYDTDGTQLWALRPAECPPISGGSLCEMSTPVIVDANGDGYEDICLIIEGDDSCYTGAQDDFAHCIDRFGANLPGYPKYSFDVAQFGEIFGRKDTNAYTADMDNDGKLEMIGPGYIWRLNGTVLSGNYSSYTSSNPIPVDVDKDGALDVVATFFGTASVQTHVFSSVATTDLEIVEIIPIQVVRDVDMVLGKTGLVRVVVRNNGGITVNATVGLIFENASLSAWNNGVLTKVVNASGNESFDFSFKPRNKGVQTFSASVTI